MFNNQHIIYSKNSQSRENGENLVHEGLFPLLENHCN